LGKLPISGKKKEGGQKEVGETTSEKKTLEKGRRRGGRAADSVAQLRANLEETGQEGTKEKA